MEVNVAINIKVETLFRGANVFREGGGRKIARGGGNISSWDISSPSDFVMGETLFCDTGMPRKAYSTCPAARAGV